MTLATNLRAIDYSSVYRCPSTRCPDRTSGSTINYAFALNFTADYLPAPIRTGNLISTPRAYQSDPKKNITLVKVKVLSSAISVSRVGCIFPILDFRPSHSAQTDSALHLVF